jgi:hypothetical protein
MSRACVACLRFFVGVAGAIVMVLLITWRVQATRQVLGVTSGRTWYFKSLQGWGTKDDLVSRTEFGWPCPLVYSDEVEHLIVGNIFGSADWVSAGTTSSDRASLGLGVWIATGVHSKNLVLVGCALYFSAFAAGHAGKRVLEARRRRSSRCVGCGYDVHGLRCCPECGEVPRSPP